MLLMAEMVLFMLLILPLPFTIRRKMFTYALGWAPSLSPWIRTANRVRSFISENPLVAKVQYGMKITFIFILILFIDSVNRVYRVQIELASTDANGQKGCVSSVPTAAPAFLNRS